MARNDCMLTADFCFKKRFQQPYEMLCCIVQRVKRAVMLYAKAINPQRLRPNNFSLVRLKPWESGDRELSVRREQPENCLRDNVLPRNRPVARSQASHIAFSDRRLLRQITQPEDCWRFVPISTVEAAHAPWSR